MALGRPRARHGEPGDEKDARTCDDDTSTSEERLHALDYRAPVTAVELPLLQRQAYVDGAWVDADSGETFPVVNPATGEVVAEVPRMGAAETRRALAAAERALPAWKARTAKDRARVLRRLSDLMLEHEDDLARLMVTEQGKPLAEARVEVAYAASFYEWFGEEAKRVYGDTIPISVAGQAHPRDEGARRRDGRHHALELPRRDADAEVRPRARGRLHDGAEAG